MCMDLSYHYNRTRDIFGKEYREVHSWLDEFITKYSVPDKYKHRKHRHHLEGALEAKKIFGDVGMLVALLHISDDNEGYIPIRGEYSIPEYDD